MFRYAVALLVTISLTGCELLYLFLDDGGSTSSYGSSSSVYDGIGAVVGQYSMSAPDALAVKDNVVYAARDGFIHVVNLFNPYYPGLILTLDGEAADAPDFRALYVDGNRLYAGSGSSPQGVYIYDITVPEVPILLGSYRRSEAASNIAVMAIYASGSHCYIAGSDGTRGRLARLDVSNPSNITAQAYVTLGNSGNAFGGLWANGAAVFADTADGHLYAFATNNLVTLDVFSNGVDYYPISGHEAWGYELTGDGSTLYWCNWGAGLLTMNISNPSNLVMLDRIGHDAGSDSVYAVVKNGTTLYAAYYWGGLLVVNGANPSALTEITRYDYDYRAYRDIVLLGDYAVCSDQGGSLGDNVPGLDIIRIK